MERPGPVVAGLAVSALVVTVAHWLSSRRRKPPASVKNKEEDEDFYWEEEDPVLPRASQGGRTPANSPWSSWNPWERQVHRPRRIVLVRHGESEANVNRHITSVVPDHMLHLTMKGRSQALEAGKMLRSIIGDEKVEFAISPYVRARETFNGIARAWGGKSEVPVRDELLIREQDFGNFDKETMAELHEEKRDFGQFYYRFPEGESPADVYNRASLFLESLYRRWEHQSHKNLVVVSHSMFLLVFMVRFFRYTIGEFYSFEPLRNCEMIVLERPADSQFFQVVYTWSPGGEMHHGGLRLKAERAPDALSQAGYTRVWDGDPDAAAFSSEPRRRSKLDKTPNGSRGQAH